MHVLKPHADLARALLALVPLIGAALIAISRCEDYRHDVYDVTIGSILGMLIAYFSYRKYYPSLKSPLCDRPFPSRTEMASLSSIGKLKDEEALIQSSEGFIFNDPEDGGENVPLRGASKGRDRVGNISDIQP